MSKQPSKLKWNLSVCPSAVALKNQQGNGTDKSSDDGKPSGLEDRRIPEGELLLQVSEQQAAMFLSQSVDPMSPLQSQPAAVDYVDISTHVKDRFLKTRNLEFVRIWDL